jgi:hypothetical protein
LFGLLVLYSICKITDLSTIRVIPIYKKAQDCQNKTQQNVEKYGNSQNRTYCTYCCRSGHLRRNVFNLKINQVKILLHGVAMGIMATMTGEILILSMLLQWQIQTHETN